MSLELLTERVDKLVQTTSELTQAVKSQSENIQCIHDKIHPLHEEYEFKKKLERLHEQRKNRLIKNLRIATLIIGIPGLPAILVWLFEKLAH